MEQHLRQEWNSIATFAQDMLALPFNFCRCAFLKIEKVISQNNDEFSFGHSVLPFLVHK